jgi:hypothetical protein
MCIFVLPAQVYGTKIAAARYAGGKRQFLMYENVVRSDTTNTMILPVPAPATSVEFVDMSAVEEPWLQLEDATPRSPSYGAGKDEYDLAEFCAVDEPPLEVFKVGGYRCSIAPSVADIRRSVEIEVPDGIEALLAEHYGSGYCFVICAFDADEKHGMAMHPIAYTHDLADASAPLFLPTRHAHGRVPADTGESATKRVRTHEDPTDEGDDFDHTLYLINAQTLAPRSTYDSASNYSKTRCSNLSAMIGADCPVERVQKVRISAASKAPNGDQWAE